MRVQHGDPYAFEDALGDALVNGMITLFEVDVAQRKYQDEWDHAPEQTVGEKP
jgi:hypothetical protein